jgi:uncharacterized iron-regulated membrane protein
MQRTEGPPSAGWLLLWGVLAIAGGVFWWRNRKDAYAVMPWPRRKRKPPREDEPGWTGYWLSLYFGSWVLILLGAAAVVGAIIIFLSHLS